MGLVSTLGFRHPLESWNVSPTDKGGSLYINPGILNLKKKILTPVVSKSFQIKNTGQPPAQIGGGGRVEKHHCKRHWTLEKVRSTQRIMARPWEPLPGNNRLAWIKCHGPGSVPVTTVTKTRRTKCTSSRSSQSGGETGACTQSRCPCGGDERLLSFTRARLLGRCSPSTSGRPCLARSAKEGNVGTGGNAREAERKKGREGFKSVKRSGWIS